MNYKDYIKLGLNHHLLYVDVVSDPAQHQQTFMRILKDERFEALDMWIPEKEPFKSYEIKAIKDSGKEIYYNVGPRKGKEIANPAGLIPGERKYALDFYKSELNRAIEVGATKLVSSSGPNNTVNRQAAVDALFDFYMEIFKYVPPKMLIMIEPIDWDADKCYLIGSSKEAAGLAKRIHASGHRNFSSMIDMAHLPLMYETIAQAMRDTGAYTGHIHMGNCILKDKSHPMFGDKHVAWGIEGGEYDIRDVAELLSLGLETGYFSKESRGSASIEMRPVPGKTPEESIDIYYDTFCRAWEMAVKLREFNKGV
ncbi:MAG: TIM barrel protein [Candidatus Omnitrophica bacterium]|nr:TIM barrel protein [Candidatus Omnitrophota bacterium]